MICLPPKTDWKILIPAADCRGPSIEYIDCHQNLEITEVSTTARYSCRRPITPRQFTARRLSDRGLHSFFLNSTPYFTLPALSFFLFCSFFFKKKKLHSLFSLSPLLPGVLCYTVLQFTRLEYRPPSPLAILAYNFTFPIDIIQQTWVGKIPVVFIPIPVSI